MNNKIDLAREKQAELIKSGQDYFLISIGLNENKSGLTFCWDENSNQPLNLVLFGLIFSLGFLLKNKNEKEKGEYCDYFDQVMYSQTDPTKNIDMEKLFRNKFCLFTFSMKEKGVNFVSSGDLVDAEIITLLAFTTRLIITQFSAAKDGIEFLERVRKGFRSFPVDRILEKAENSNMTQIYNK